MASSSNRAIREVDQDFWRHIAGKDVSIPDIGTSVYYLPEGHFEHLSPDAKNKVSPVRKMSIKCWIQDLKLLADPDSDEVYYKAMVVPGDSPAIRPVSILSSNIIRGQSHPKTLTRSDANNGGAFTVPKTCATCIFPTLHVDLESRNLPSQILELEDVHGARWEMRHVYRGSPKRHLMTTGWSKFSDAKKLIAGDSVLFYKKEEGKVLLGIQRAGEGHERAFRGMLTEGSVLNAVQLAEMGMPFEVVFYPRKAADFLVRTELYEAAMAQGWVPGIKIKMEIREKHCKSPKVVYGTVASLKQHKYDDPWCSSSWRMLQVTWDEDREELMKEKFVSPWKVQMITAAIYQPPPPTVVPVEYNNRNGSNQQQHNDERNAEGEFAFIPLSTPNNGIGRASLLPGNIESSTSSTENSSGRARSSIMLFGKNIFHSPLDL